MTKNPTVLKWLEEMKELLGPKDVMWIDGSDKQTEALRKEACESGELIKLNVLENSGEDAYDLLQDLAAQLGAEPVAVVGRKIVLYRASEKKPVIVLPTK